MHCAELLLVRWFFLFKESVALGPSVEAAPVATEETKSNRSAISIDVDGALETVKAVNSGESVKPKDDVIAVLGSVGKDDTGRTLGRKTDSALGFEDSDFIAPDTDEAFELGPNVVRLASEAKGLEDNFDIVASAAAAAEPELVLVVMAGAKAPDVNAEVPNVGLAVEVRSVVETSNSGNPPVARIAPRGGLIGSIGRACGEDGSTFSLEIRVTAVNVGELSAARLMADSSSTIELELLESSVLLFFWSSDEGAMRGSGAKAFATRARSESLSPGL